jgi:plasmid maintenance system antidote protein VapI
MRWRWNRLSDILRGKRAMTTETALRLGRYLGTGSVLWLNMQAQYDLAVVEPDHGAQIAQEVTVAVAATALKGRIALKRTPLLPLKPTKVRKSAASCAKLGLPRHGFGTGLGAHYRKEAKPAATAAAKKRA